ncbi:uncharacterized protein Z518_00755 [Rhinocladiella mackenziei CBS 650.93]|uniref:Rhinocladiella mackenziei CBS 650.93 unplaced genomic scaffold supercont1.1, whole genome shotgun sequence n=1 Tax=Rhinocladiella mackenziei CBS 650.93 TaxID=1442369 RepID=A0A0D2IUD3_9EURO|nr:uncharacterized protein Z518_00755 [Rhinocladiella mackenziei CBS 650.93]KIX09674.1 hypothetical protein Z518_00755 [Rhinocladiella mackenziei CBS 650.93]
MEPQGTPPSIGGPSSPDQQLTPASKKRNYEGHIINNSNSFTPPTDQQSCQLTATRSHTESPTINRARTPLNDLGPPPVLSPSQHPIAPDSKKRKLTFAEREVERAVKRREKEEKEKQKAEAKVKKEEEKKRKDEEKDAARKAREALKEERQRQKDVERQEKEAERERKAAEARKKERSQMRIGAFFGRPAPASTPPTTPDDVLVEISSRRPSIASVDMEPPVIETVSCEPANPEYNKWILPFFVSGNMELAPFNRFRSNTSLVNDDHISLNQHITPEKISARFRRRRQARPVKPVKEILELSNGSADAPIELGQTTDPLVGVPYKYLFFHQDVRPAYQGTYTRPVSPRTARKIAITPSYRGLPGTDYDYDSEAEWQEPEEGDDDLMDEDEKSEDEDVGEEMDDFLDDEGQVVKRQHLVSDMEPKSSGLCWEGEDTLPENGFDLAGYRMDVLHDATKFPIDPYSTSHWCDIAKTSPDKTEKKQPSPLASMSAPRLPLMAVDGNSGNLVPRHMTTSTTNHNRSENQSLVSTVKANGSAGTGKPVKTIPSDILPAFKVAVSGSTLTKTGLIEVLKNQFPKCSKDAIKYTLPTIAERRGAKEGEKKWVLIN